MASLIQQRFALGRRRLRALLVLTLGVVSTVYSVALLVLDPSSPAIWVNAGLWATVTVYGLNKLLEWRRAVREFETEHGVGAGNQS